MGTTVMLLCAITPETAAAAGWVVPTGNTDGTGWSNGNLARDGSTATYASHSPALGWGGWETFSLDTTIWSDRFRVMADFGYGEVDSVQVDVSPDDVTWTTAYAGTVADASWDTKTYSPQDVRYARFRFHRLATGYNMWLYELQIYEASLTINPPTITTSAATSIDVTSAIVHGLLTADGGEPCDIRFQYGLTTSYELDSTAWVSDYVTGNTSGSMVTEADSGVTYHFRAQARNSQGTANGDDATFTCGPVGAGWVSPTGHSDATGRWENNPNIYDDEVGSNARCNHPSNDPTGQWGPYIYLLHSSMGADSIRFLAKDDNNIDQAQVDVSADGVTWFNVYDAAFANQTWTIVSFAPQYVSQARIRFHVSSNSAGLYWELNEFDFQTGRALGVTLSKSVIAFGTQLLDSWLPADSTIITNDGGENEAIVGKISTFTSGANTWTLSASANGPNQVRAQWSTTSAAGPWTDIAAYDTDFIITPDLVPSGTVKLYLRIQTPTSTASYNQHSTTFTATAQ